MEDRFRRLLAALAAFALIATGLTAAQPAAAVKPPPAAVKAATALKGLPLVDAKTKRLSGKVQAGATGNASALLAGPYYHYTEVHQFLGDQTAGNGATGVAVLVSQHNPQVQDVAGEAHHSLWEVAATANGQQDAIEIGIREVAGAGEVPELFAFTWVAGVPQGYADAVGTNPGWKDNPGQAVNAGTALAYTAPGAAPSVFYQYRIDRVTNPAWCTGTCGTPAGFGTGWEVAQTNQGQTRRIIGGFPDSHWTSQGSTMPAIQLVQMFGETVSTIDPNSCSDMANGVYGTSTAPSAAGHQLAYSLLGAPTDPTTGVTEVNVPDGVGVQPAGSSPNAYRMWQDPSDLDEIRWGGPGFVGGATNYTGTTAGSVQAC